MNLNLARIGLIMASWGLAGCGGPHSPFAPSASSAPSPSASTPSGKPVVQTSSLQPTITGVSPNVVSTSGTWGTITGTQFQPGATVKIGDAAVMAVFRDSATIQFPNSGAHSVGSVDVTVTNVGGLAATLAHGYLYSTADVFDANGEWIAHADAHNDYVTDMRFTVRNNTLVSLSCGTPVFMPSTLSVQNGAFSFAGADGLTLSGTLVSTTTSYGEVNAPGCGDGRWWAEKAPPPQF
jgi:hypothetical protein